MTLPFSVDQFHQVFQQYNEAVWPMQIGLLAMAAAAAWLAVHPVRHADRFIAGILAFLWAWLGLVYHAMFFSAINPAARIFAGISLIGSVLFLLHGVVRQRMHFRAGGLPARIGAMLMLYGVFVYPAWVGLLDLRYPAVPSFGLPCPVTFFTIGMCMMLAPPYPRGPLVVPVLWCLVGTQAAFLLGMTPDLLLLLAGVAGIAQLARARANPATAQA